MGVDTRKNDMKKERQGMNKECQEKITEIILQHKDLGLECEWTREGYLRIKRKCDNQVSFEKNAWKLRNALELCVDDYGLSVCGDGGRMSLSRAGDFMLVFVPRNARAQPVAPNVNKNWKP